MPTPTPAPDNVSVFVQAGSYIATAATTAALTWWGVRNSQKPATERALDQDLDKKRQEAVETQAITISALNARIDLLVSRAQEQEERHEAALTELRGQLTAQLARKELIISQMQQDSATKELEIGELRGQIETLQQKQTEMAAALAEYALRDSRRRTRMTDQPATISQEAGKVEVTP